MERRKNTCEILLERYKRKSFLHCIWEWKVDFFLEFQAQKIMGRPRTIHIDRKTESLWQEDDVVFGGTRKVWSIMSYWSRNVNTKRYQQQLIDLNRSLLKKRLEYQKRQHKIIFLHDNAPSHTTKPVRNTLEALSWEVLPHAAYSPDLAPSDYHLFASMNHAFAEQRFGTKMWKNGSMNGSRQKGKIFTGVVSTNCPKDGKNV